MKFTAEKNAILEVTLPTSGFASGKSTIATTEDILFRTTGDGSCDIVAYDLEKGIKTSLECTVEEEGCAVIQCHAVYPNSKDNARRADNGCR